MTELILPTRYWQPRIAELVVNITGFVEGELKDWPSNIQDGIFEALALRQIEDKCRYTIIHSRCGREDGQFYVHIIAKEERPVLH